MEIRELTDKVYKYFKKYGYALIVLLVGIGLLVFPSFSGKNEKTVETPSVDEKSVSQQLAEILSMIDGAGKVQVMLTVRKGEETIFQVDEDVNKDEGSSSTKITTILVNNSERIETGLIKQMIPPIYQGAIIVCQGADNANVRLSIVEAVSRVTGLGASQISVLKMK